MDEGKGADQLRTVQLGPLDTGHQIFKRPDYLCFLSVHAQGQSKVEPDGAVGNPWPLRDLLDLLLKESEATLAVALPVVDQLMEEVKSLDVLRFGFVLVQQ